MDATAAVDATAADAAPSSTATSDADQGAAGDEQSTDTALPAPLLVTDDGPPYEVIVAADCAVPLGAAPSAACAAKTCPTGKTCMSTGLCLPSGPFVLRDPGHSQVHAALATSGGGRFAVAYAAREVSDNAAREVRLQVFEGDDVEGSTPIAVGGPSGPGGEAMNISPVVLSLESAGWLVGWSARKTPFLGTPRLRRVGAAGKVGPLYALTPGAVGLWASNAGPLRLARTLESRRNLAVWQAGGKASAAIFARSISDNGAPLRPTVEITAPEDMAWAPAVTPWRGGFLVVWTSWWGGSKKGKVRVRGRQIAADGSPVGTAFESPGWTPTYPYAGEPNVIAFDDHAVLTTFAVRESATTPSPTYYLSSYIPNLPAKPALGSTFWLSTGAQKQSGPPYGAPLVRTSATRAVAVAVDKASKSGWHDAVSVRRFYRKHKVFDCEGEDAALTPPGTKRMYRQPAIAAFDDGRLIVAWGEDLALPGEQAAPHIRLRFLSW